MIVDDEKNIVDLLADILKDAGFNKVFVAYNGAEALSILSENGRDIYLILLDLMMPRISGIELIKHLLNVHVYPVGIIIITGYASIESASEFIRLSRNNIIAIDYVKKPFKVENLLEEIEYALERIHKKRLSIGKLSTQYLADCLVMLQNKIKHIDKMDEINNKLDKLIEANSIIRQLGVQIVVILIIGLMIITFLFFGVDSFIVKILKSLKIVT